MTDIVLVVARADNGVIGNAGGIPWRISEDMRRFKALTLNKPVIMGRKTWDSLPRKPLQQRTNIIVTRDLAFKADGAIIVHSADEAWSRASAAKEAAVIGGSEIYRAALPKASRIELTAVHAAFPGDTSLPEFDHDVWKETARETHATAEGLSYSFVTLLRRAAVDP